MALRLALVIAVYLIGSFPTALVYSHLAHRTDIRTLGDGNMGARNIKRQFGFAAGRAGGAGGYPQGGAGGAAHQGCRLAAGVAGAGRGRRHPRSRLPRVRQVPRRAGVCRHHGRLPGILPALTPCWASSSTPSSTCSSRVPILPPAWAWRLIVLLAGLKHTPLLAHGIHDPGAALCALQTGNGSGTPPVAACSR